MKKILIIGLFLVTLISCFKNKEKRVSFFIDEQDTPIFSYEISRGGNNNEIILPDESLYKEKEGYNFIGWYLDKEFTKEFKLENYILKESLNLYAKYEIKKLDVTIYKENEQVEKYEVFYNEKGLKNFTNINNYLFYSDKEYNNKIDIKEHVFKSDTIFYLMMKKKIKISVLKDDNNLIFNQEEYFIEDDILINVKIKPGYEIHFYEHQKNYIKNENQLKFENFSKEELNINYELKPISNLPVINININNQEIKNKIDYVEGTFKIENSNFTDYEDMKMGIRLRGNSTYSPPKKPYRIKFEEKISLMGSKQEKSFVLLADWFDQSQLRNYFGYTLSQKIMLNQFSPMAHHIHLFIDDDYKGLYLLTDQINESRVDIKEKKLGKKDEVPFLLEIDARATNEKILGEDYFLVGNLNYVIKYPSRADGLRDNQFLYIKNYIEKLNGRIENNDNYEELLDIDSFINYLLVMEYMGNPEINGLSVFLYKEKGSKIKFGPIWDLDLSADNYHYFAPDDLLNNWMSEIKLKTNWFSILIKNNDFKIKFKNRWNQVLDIIDNHIVEINLYKEKIFDALNYSFYQFEEIKKTFDYYIVYDNYDIDFNKMLDYLQKRKIWIAKQLN